MNLIATLSADIRAKASHLPFCPLCSHIGVQGFPDALRGPSHREFRGRHKLTRCCKLSATDEQFESEAAASAWWRQRRLEPLKDIATDRRRLNTLRKLSEANLEPIE